MSLSEHGFYSASGERRFAGHQTYIAWEKNGRRPTLDQRRYGEHDFTPVPCGQCIACRMNRSQEWAIRCMAEASLYKHNYFVTLTYSPESIDKYCFSGVESFDPDSGAIDFRYSLEKSRISKFMKALRQNLGDGIRFFGCGEYGSLYNRPHYHICLFNMPELSLIPWENRDGYQVYRSPEIERTWKLGFSTVGEVNYHTCAYVARYIMKKQTGLDASSWRDPLKELMPDLAPYVPEYVIMSRRPGIARAWLGDPADSDSEISDIYRSDKVVLNVGGQEVKTVKPPRYFDKIFDTFDPEAMEQIKTTRLFLSDLRQRSVDRRTDLDHLEQLDQAAMMMERKLKRLPRKEL